MKHRFLSASLCVSLALPAAAQSIQAPATTDHKEDQHVVPAAEHTLTGNLAIASQYVFRGLSQTNGKSALQGGFDYAHASGWYAGTWLSNISWFTDQNAGVRSAPTALSSPGAVGAPYVRGRSNAASLEWDIYAGHKGSLTADVGYDAGMVGYAYPGTYDNVGAYRSPNTMEAYIGVTYKWVTLKYSKGVTRYTFGVNESRGASYLDLSANVPIGESGFTLIAHVGRQNYPGKPNFGYWGSSGGNNNFFDYTDYKVGLSKEIGKFSAAASYTYANTRNAAPDGQTTAYMNAFGRNIGRGRFSVVISRTF